MINNNNISPSGSYGVIGTANLTNVEIPIGRSVSRTFPVVSGCLYHVRIPLFMSVNQDDRGEGMGRAYGWITLATDHVQYRSIYQFFNKTNQNNFVDVYLIASGNTLTFTMDCINSDFPTDTVLLLQGSAICVQLV